MQGCAENVEVATSSTVALADKTDESYTTCLLPAEDLIRPNFRWGDLDGSKFCSSIEYMYKIDMEYSSKLQVLKSGQYSCDDGRWWHGWSDFKKCTVPKNNKKA